MPAPPTPSGSGAPPPLASPTSREPFLASAFASPAGSDARARIDAWAAAVATRMGQLGYDVSPSGVATSGGQAKSASATSPSTLVVLARSERAPDELRARIVLFIDPERVEVAVNLPPAGAVAARSRIADPVRALELTTAFEALPEQFAIGVVGEGERAPASRASTDQIRALLDRAEREQRPLWVGWSIPRDVAVEHALLLDEQLEDAAVALGSVLTLLALAPGRFGPAAGERPASRRRDKREGTQGDDERPGAKRRARERDDGVAPARTAHGQYAEPRERGAERSVERDAGEHDATSPPRNQRGGGAKASVRTLVRVRRSGHADPTPIDKGSRVRVLEGPFCGKVGVVQELDGKGGARVMLGLLAVRVVVRDLTRCAEGHNRPVLSTSHRKPMPVRS